MTDSRAPFFPQLSEISAFKAALLKLPDQLHKARLGAADAYRHLAAAQKRVGDVKEDLGQRENELVLEVTANKEAFPNETVRRAEVKRRQTVDKEYQQGLSQIRAAEAEVLRAQMAKSQADLEVQRLEDEQRAVRIHADLVCAEVQLLVAGR